MNARSRRVFSGVLHVLFFAFLLSFANEKKPRKFAITKKIKKMAGSTLKILPVPMEITVLKHDIFLENYHVCIFLISNDQAP
jgi:hypothetical protein